MELTGYLTTFEAGTTNAIAAQGALKDTEREAWTVGRAALRVTAVLATLAAICLAIMIAVIPLVMQKAPPGLPARTQGAMLLVGISSIGYVVGASGYGASLGAQRMLLPGMATFVARALAAIAVVCCAYAGFGIVALAGLWAFGNCIVPLCLAAIAVRRGTGIGNSREGRRIRRKTFAYARSYSVWVIAGFLIVGLDSSIVAWRDFAGVGPYAVAASLPLTIQAALSAALASVVPLVSRSALDPANNHLVGRGILNLSTDVAIGLAVMVASLTIAAAPIMTALAGRSAHGGQLLFILLLASVVRLSFLTMSTAVLATGEHGRVVFVPLVEGIVNLGASCVMAVYLGALGVALGTLLGALASAISFAFILVPRLKSMRIGSPMAAIRPVSLAMLLVAPCAAVGGLHCWARLEGLAYALWACAALASTSVMATVLRRHRINLVFRGFLSLLSAKERVSAQE